MLSHITIGAKDKDASARFYDAVLSPLGYSMTDLGRWALFSAGEGQPPVLVGKPHEGEASYGNGLMLGFGGGDPDKIQAAHAAGVKAGGTDEGAPGPRPAGPPGTYAAYLRDPTGNKIGLFCRVAT